MTAVMIHRDGDTAATVDQVPEEGPEFVRAGLQRHFTLCVADREDSEERGRK